MWKALKFIFAIGLIGFALIITAGVIIGITEGESTLAEDFWVWFIVGFIPLVAGISIIYSLIRASKNNKKQSIENELFKLAKAYEGNVTASELAMETSLNLSEAEKLLETFVSRGVVVRKISDSGIFVYQFPMISDKEKSTAKGIYEI